MGRNGLGSSLGRASCMSGSGVRRVTWTTARAANQKKEQLGGVVSDSDYFAIVAHIL
jgi:hypothetical protein